MRLENKSHRRLLASFMWFRYRVILDFLSYDVVVYPDQQGLKSHRITDC